MKRKTWLIVLSVIAGVCCIASFVIYKVLESRPPSRLSDSGYYVRGSKVFYHPGFGLAEPFEIPGVDAKSFVAIDSSYGRDKTHVYLDGVAIPGADPDSFEIFDNTFTRDANHVYLQGQVFSDDAVHFEHVEGNIYRDSQHIYWSTSIISDDPSHLVVLGNSGFYTFLKDSKTVYIQGSPIQDADPATFEPIADAYSRDASHIFYFDQAIADVDSSTFEVIASPYSRDAAHVYFMESILPEADPATFVVLNVDFQCSADATHAYYQGESISNFDPASIPPGAVVTNCDASGIYFSQ